MSRSNASLATAVTFLALAGCSNPAEPTPNVAGNWNLVSATIDGTDYQPRSGATTLVSMTGKGGQAISGCDVATMRIVVTPGRVQMRAKDDGGMLSCPPGSTDALDGHYVEALERVTDAVKEGDSLRLSGSHIEMRFKAAD